MINYNHYIVIFFIMIISGLLTTMNVFVDKIDDIRLSINDIYMTTLMTGWMFLLMGFWYKEFPILLFGLILIIINLLCIRTQFLVSTNQYIIGMIPHHSMAIHMSKKLIKNEEKSNIKDFVNNIISTQEEEIKFMKKNEIEYIKDFVNNIISTQEEEIK